MEALTSERLKGLKFLQLQLKHYQYASSLPVKCNRQKRDESKSSFRDREIEHEGTYSNALGFLVNVRNSLGGVRVEAVDTRMIGDGVVILLEFNR